MAVGIKSVGGFLLVLALMLGLCGCALPPPPDLPVSDSGAATTAETDNRWQEMFAWTPYPYSDPLPDAQASSIDGIYVKVDPRPGERAGCRRCPPYPPEGGVWKWGLHNGVFRAFHVRTGWRSLGSFAIDGDEIRFFNDPQCIHSMGRYIWAVREGELHFTLIEDDCGNNLRAKFLTAQPWQSCQPPNEEAAVTDHWPAPSGCR